METTVNQQSARVLAVTSGKGGVGKSNVSTNLAIALARSGRRVCLFDADTGLANINILLGLRPTATLEDLLADHAGIDDILVTAPGGIDIVPAASGVASLTRLDTAAQSRLLEALHTLEARYDYLILDTAAGISNTVTLFLHAAPETLLVVTPEPTSLTDAFALLKVLQRQRCRTRVHVLTNRVADYRNSVDVYRRLANASQRYLGTRPEYLGYLPDDPTVALAVRRQQPLLTGWPGAPASRNFEALARNLETLLVRQTPAWRLTRFWQALLQKRNGGRAVPPPRSRNVPPVTARSGPPVRQNGNARFSRPAVSRLQQHMVRLISSRVLPRSTLLKLLGSLLRTVRREYPDISREELNALSATPGRKMSRNEASKSGEQPR